MRALLAVAVVVSVGCSSAPPVAKETPVSDLSKKIARFAPTEIGANTDALVSGDRDALAKIVAASKHLDPLFLRQVWSGNPALAAKLSGEALHYFRINKGP